MQNIDFITSPSVSTLQPRGRAGDNVLIQCDAGSFEFCCHAYVHSYFVFLFCSPPWVGLGSLVGAPFPLLPRWGGPCWGFSGWGVGLPPPGAPWGLGPASV